MRLGLSKQQFSLVWSLYLETLTYKDKITLQYVATCWLFIDIEVDGLERPFRIILFPQILFRSARSGFETNSLSIYTAKHTLSVAKM